MNQFDYKDYFNNQIYNLFKHKVVNVFELELTYYHAYCLLLCYGTIIYLASLNSVYEFYVETVRFSIHKNKN